MPWRRLSGGGDAPPGLGGPKGLVDGVENRLRRPERESERHLGERPFGVAMSLVEGALHFGEHLRRRPLESEDRLLLVADRKYRAVRRARPGAGEELGGQRSKNAPLRR